MFLPWLVVEGGPFDIGMDLPTLMSGERALAPFSMGFGLIYVIGTMLMLIWKKAFIVQLAGLSLLLPVMGTIAGTFTLENGTCDALMALASTLGPGAYMGWTAALLGIFFQNSMRSGWPIPSWLPGRGKVDGAASCLLDEDHGGPSTVSSVSRPKVGTLIPVGGTRTVYEDMMADGEAAAERGDLTTALRSYGHALGSSHDGHRRAECKVRIALLLLEMGDIGEAHLFIQEAKRLDPESLRYGSDVGRLLPARKLPRRGRRRTGVSPEP